MYEGNIIYIALPLFRCINNFTVYWRVEQMRYLIMSLT